MKNWKWISIQKIEYEINIKMLEILTLCVCQWWELCSVTALVSIWSRYFHSFCFFVFFSYFFNPYQLRTPEISLQWRSRAPVAPAPTAGKAALQLLTLLHILVWNLTHGKISCGKLCAGDAVAPGGSTLAIQLAALSPTVFHKNSTWSGETSSKFTRTRWQKKKRQDRKRNPWSGHNWIIGAQKCFNKCIPLQPDLVCHPRRNDVLHGMLCNVWILF